MSEPLESRILRFYARLTASERRIADVVLEHQRHLSSFTATELAAKASVSKATAARLFKILGYASFADARQESRQGLRWGAPLATSAPEGGSVEPDAADHLEIEIDNLRLSFERLSNIDIEGATQAIVETPRLFIVGMRGSNSLAHYARFLFQMLKPDVRLVTTSSLSLAEEALDIGEGDVVLAIAYRRRPAILPEFLGVARERGARILLVTDLTASQTASLAHWVVRCCSRAPFGFDSYTPGLSILNYLSSRVMAALGETARARILDKEDLHERLDAFTTSGGWRGHARRAKRQLTEK